MAVSLSESTISRAASPLLSKREIAASRLNKIYLTLLKPIKELSRIFYSQPPIRLADRKIAVFPLFVKTDTEVFDQKCFYIIRDGKVYFKPLAAGDTDLWKQIPFSKKAVKISADGDNLIVLDENQRVHYAKTTGIQFHVTDCSWDVSDFKLDWKKDWFNMDLVSSLVNFMKPAGLYAMEGARALAISHKGQDAYYYTDIAGKRHPDPFIGVTTLYMLDPSGTRIFFADPWLANKFHNEITGPEEGRFVAETLDANASTLFVFQRARDASGKEIHKMYTRYADFDSTGSNPFLPSTYDPENKIPLVRVLPGEDWMEQPCIPLEGNAHLTKRIAILQTGRGQANRQLRVEGTDRQGRTGYYYKNIYDKTWAFERTNHYISPDAFLTEEERGSGFALGPKVAHDYEGSIQTGQGTFHSALKKFSFRGLNERGLHTTVEMQLSSGEKISCPLYARRGLKHLFCLDMHRPHWTLVAPDMRQVAKIGKQKIPFRAQNVAVNVSQQQIVVKGRGFNASFPIDGHVPFETSLPPLTTRSLIKVTLPFLNGIKFVCKIIRRVLDRLSYNFKTTKHREQFFNSLQLCDREDTKKVMVRLHASNPSLAPQIVIDLLSQASIWPHLRELMRGANAQLQGNTGELFRKLTQLQGATQRISSHAYQEGTSYGVEIPLFGELLFWKDLSGNLRLQFEAHSLGTIFNIYYHFIDYLYYKLHGRQQGLYGSSRHTDANPLILQSYYTAPT